MKQISSPSITDRLKEYQTKDDIFWKRRAEQTGLRLFLEMSERVPAYKDFLKKHHIKPDRIKTGHDFRQIPIIDKPTYIDRYPLNELCWDGNIHSSYMLSASSGSTGLPYFWPRSVEQTAHGASISESIYQEYFQMHKRPTLYIVAFSMGTWIAGTYMMMSTQRVAQLGYPLTVVTPGINKEEILRLVEMGKKYYQQIILIGYPPFIKDVIDSGIERGMKWNTFPIRFMFSAEAFTEGWRDHLQKKVQFENIYTDAINIYGSADVGINAHETVTTVYLRRLARKRKELCERLFHASRIPSVNQFDPNLRYFEKVGEELCVSARCGIPLVRYNTKDIGDVLYFGEAIKILKDSGVSFIDETKKLGINRLVWTLPIVYLFGRGKFSATVYGITIYPEYMKTLLDIPRLESYVTGKFILATEETKNHDEVLHVRIELKEHISISKDFCKLVHDTFVKELPSISSEYRHLLSSIGIRAYPKITLHEYGDSQFFPRGVVKKTA